MYPGDFYIETTVDKVVKNHKSEHFNNVIKDLVIKVALFSSGGSSYFDKSEKQLYVFRLKKRIAQLKKQYHLV